MILGTDGERLSKRHGAVSVTQYREDGYLPDALVNYLARLGWSHGDEEIFDRDQLIAWFDLTSINHAPAKFDPQKLRWLNQQYLKTGDLKHLAKLAIPFLERDNCDISDRPDLLKVVNLLKERVDTIEELADAAVYFFRPLEPSSGLKAQHFNLEVKPVLNNLVEKFNTIEWNHETIHNEIKKTASEHGIKLPKLAMPLRVMVTGEAQTPSIAAVLELLGREETLKRMNNRLTCFPD